MVTTLPALSPLEDSLFLTLCCRALDNRTPHPVLGDAMADEIVRTLDYDYRQLHIDTNLRLNVALRAKKMDEVASGFLARHPDAVGLDLGAGLDTRSVRIDAPSTVDWYDVDFPAVVAARERLIPASRERAHHRRGRDLPGVAGRPPHRPAGRDRRRRPDGVPHPGRAGLPARPADQPLPHRRDRLQQLHAGPRSGRPSTTPAPGPSPTCSGFPASTTRTSRRRWNPRLKLVREIVLGREPEVAQFPPVLRLYHRLSARSTVLSRLGTIILHYRF